MHTHSRSILLLLSLTLSSTCSVRADFEPIAFTTNSYNQDVIVEKTAPPPAIPVTSASMDQGSSGGGYAWFERGYLPEWPSYGFPQAGSILISDQASDHAYQMPPNYRTANAVMVDGTHSSVSISVRVPDSFSALSFLTSSGGAKNLIRYTIHHQDTTSETGTFYSPNWYNDGPPAWATSGSINVASFARADLGDYNPRLYAVDIVLENRFSPIVGVDLALESGVGHTAVFAVSGAAAPGGDFVPIEINAFNEDVVVEASAIKPEPLANTTATMDMGTANRRFTWYEQGYYPLALETGLPAAGTFLSFGDHQFQLPASYTNRNAMMLDSVCSNCAARLLSPSCFSTISFLSASAHGPTTNRCIVKFTNGTFETNFFICPDWLQPGAPAALTTRGYVSVSTRLISIADEPASPKLYAVDVPIAHCSNLVSELILSPAHSVTDGRAMILAVSGVSTGSSTRPSLQITRSFDGKLAIQSTQPGTLESSSQLNGSKTIWTQEGPISDKLTLAPAPTDRVRFYRVRTP